MIDPLSISAIIIAIIGALGVFINRTHLSRIICCHCIESDCQNNNNELENIEITQSIPSPKNIKKIIPNNLNLSEV